MSSRPTWSTRASSRTGFKATEKPCLEKQKKKKFLWCVPVISAQWRKRPDSFKIILSYLENSRPAWVTRKLVFKNK